MKRLTIPLVGGIMLAASAIAAVAYDECTIAVIETRPCDTADRAPDNSGGWIETRICDVADVSTPIDTSKPLGIIIKFR